MVASRAAHGLLCATLAVSQWGLMPLGFGTRPMLSTVELR